MKPVWAAQALKDRRAIYDHIDASNPAAAINLDKRFADAADLLTAHPALGHPGRARGTLEFVVHRHYVLIYALSRNALHILRVMHTSRNWPAIR